MKRFKNVYQFKITLKGTKPLVWRRIQVPETYTFYDFHLSIQDEFSSLENLMLQKADVADTVTLFFRGKTRQNEDHRLNLNDSRNYVNGTAGPKEMIR
ncbi:MAG TPA: hypothetical protein VF260_08410 [Bacilli bacterium]